MFKDPSKDVEMCMVVFMFSLFLFYEKKKKKKKTTHHKITIASKRYFKEIFYDPS